MNQVWCSPDQDVIDTVIGQYVHSCKGRTFQAHPVNSLTVTVFDLFCVTGLLKYSILL